MIFLFGIVVAALYAADVKIRGVSLRSEEGLQYASISGVSVVAVLTVWIWQPIADALAIVLFVVNLVGVESLLPNWKVTAGAGVATHFVAWLVQNWWFWIIVIEV